jgi:Asp-tRNA(Asn)/Glu-tRNA(Gln) amidotransferase A subunit family amidase
MANSSPQPAIPLDKDGWDGAAYCTIPNIFDWPAISIPCGFSPDGLPIGLQIIGPRFGEAAVLAVANQY